jgi:PAS domain S-box-containing protein
MRSRLARIVSRVFRELSECERSNERLRLGNAALAAAANGIVIAHRSGKMVWVNDAFSTMTGYSAAEAVGQNPRIIKSGAQDEAFYQDMWRAILSGKVWRGEVVNKRKDGSLYHEDMIITPVVERGEITHFIAIKQDVTAKRRAQQEILSLARFPSENPNPVLRIDRSGILLHANEAGYASLRDWQLAPGKPAPAVLQSAVLEAFAKRMRKTVDTEHDERIISFFIVPIEQAGYANVYGQDITERKRADEALRNQAGELRAREEQNLRLLNELKKREEDLRENDRRKDEFLAMLAHELRNPLAPIRNIVETPRMCESAECAWDCSVVEKEVSHLARLLDDLLDVSRITRNQLQLRRERVSLTDVVHSAVKSSRPFIDHNHHELTVNLPPESIYLDGDRVRLVQVFVNLLNNAAKYTRQGGQIQVGAERKGGDIVVTVKDNGSGIAADKLPYLFDPFYQAGRSHEQTYGGLGIGLTLVKRLVELQGGTVEARSRGPNQGSEFNVRLPVIAKPVQTLKSQEPLVATVSRRILIVDDYPNVAESMARRLHLAGHEVKTALDGFQAIQAAENFRPEIILLDIGMPKLDGYETARRIRAQPWGIHIALVAVTGWGQEEDRRLSREAGFDAHLVKPVEKKELANLLARLPQARADAVAAEP